MIWRLIYNCWFSIIINGTSKGFFRPFRDFRRGDPISPALFVITAKGLSRALNIFPQHRSFIPFKIQHNCPIITPLAFADDVIIFSSRIQKILELIRDALKSYERYYGQKVNVSKSGLFTHPNIPLARKMIIHQVSRFTCKTFPT